MKIEGNFRRKSAVLLSSTVAIALTLAGCTSVEVASKGDVAKPQIASAPQATAAQTQETAAANPAGTASATAQVAANSTTEPLRTAVALKGGRVALPPASEIAAAAAIDA